MFISTQNKTVGSGANGSLVGDDEEQISLKFSHDLGEVQECWEHFETISWHSSFQKFCWVKAWLDSETKNNIVQPLIIRGYQANRLQFILPLIIEKKRGHTQLTWMANNLNDYNMPLALEEFLTTATPQLIEEIWQSIGIKYPNIDLYNFSMQPVYWSKYKNPFIIEPSIHSSCSSHAMSLEKNWTKLYNESRSKKTQNRLKQKLSRLNKIAKVSFRSPKKQSETQELVEIIHTWKIDQLVRSGDRIPATFSAMHSILKKLLKVKNSNLVRVFGLYLDGKLIAGMVVFINDGVFSLYNTAYKPNFKPNCSVGKILLVKCIELASRSGFEYFDFMSGDEAYKAEWANKSVVLKESFVGMSIKGKIFARRNYLKLVIKTKLKNNKFAMSLLRSLNIFRNTVHSFLRNFRQNGK